MFSDAGHVYGQSDQWARFAVIIYDQNDRHFVYHARRWNINIIIHLSAAARLVCGPILLHILHANVWLYETLLTLSLLVPLRFYTLPYWSNQLFIIFHSRTLGRSGLSAS